MNYLTTFVAYAENGSSFVYGKNLIAEEVFMFKILSVIFFFSFMTSILNSRTYLDAKENLATCHARRFHACGVFVTKLSPGKCFKNF